MKISSEHPPSSTPQKATEPTLGQDPVPGLPRNSLSALWHNKSTIIATISIVAIVLHLVLRFGFKTTPGTYQISLLAALILGGLPLLYDLLRKLLKREFGSDLLGGISIITSILLGEYLAGLDYRLNAGRRRSVGELRVTQRLFGAGRLGETDAFDCPQETRKRKR